MVLFSRSSAFHGRSQSSHGLRASAFRAAKALQHQQQNLLSRQAPAAPVYIPNAPVYVPKIGLANVTMATPYPPPPPALEPWNDSQPLDTQLGHYIISGFLDQPTVTPPPLQLPLAMQSACPILMSWPKTVAVSLPSPCSATRGGNWTDPKSKKHLLEWDTGCMDLTGTGLPSVTPFTTYSISDGRGGGALFGTSAERKSVFGHNIELRDCLGTALFTVEEKVYKYPGEVDDDSCRKYKSCDGVIYLQYFIKDARGSTVAMTGYLNIFASEFEITDTKGMKIATAWRKGWEPGSKDCSDAVHRAWLLEYAEAPPGIWAQTMVQWPIASMMTMLAQRDEMRLPTGHVMVTNCEVMKSTICLLSAILFILCCIVVPCLSAIMFAPWCRTALHDLEHRFFPRRMGKPSAYS